MLNKRTLLWLGVWAILLASAFLVDQPVARWAYGHRFHHPTAGVLKNTPWADAIKALGSYFTVIALACILLLAGAFTWRRFAILLLCSATAIITEPLKWIFGRSRPVSDAGHLSNALGFVPFSTRETGNSLPSGHAMLAFATAVCLARYFPRYSLLFYALAAIVALERVLEVAHYASDVVAAAGIGIIVSRTCMWALMRWFPEPAPPVLQPAKDVKS